MANAHTIVGHRAAASAVPNYNIGELDGIVAFDTTAMPPNSQNDLRNQARCSDLTWLFHGLGDHFYIFFRYVMNFCMQEHEAQPAVPRVVVERFQLRRRRACGTSSWGKSCSEAERSNGMRWLALPLPNRWVHHSSQPPNCPNDSYG